MHRCSRCGVADEGVKCIRSDGKWVHEQAAVDPCITALQREVAALREAMSAVAVEFAREYGATVNPQTFKSLDEAFAAFQQTDIGRKLMAGQMRMYF